MITTIKIGDRIFNMQSGTRLKEENKRNLDNNKIPERFKNIHFDDLIVTENNKIVIDRLKKYALNFLNCKNSSILLSGKVGTGKTLLACLVLKEILKNGFTGEITTTIDFLDNIKKCYNPNGNQEDVYISKLCNANLLILDDIGTEKITEWSYDRIYKIINYRYINKKATIFTSNCSIKGLYKHLDERLTSRIESMCNVKFLLDSADWRKKND